MEQGDPPTRFRLGKLPFASLQYATGRSGNELVFGSTKLGASLIHRLGNTVWSVADQVLFKGVAKEATAGSLGLASQALGPLE